jgi:thioredoxin-like negative regulator of GroEL
VAAQTGLALVQRGRFGEGNRLLERAAEVSRGHHRAELMLAHGMRTAGRLREAAEALDRLSGRRSR